MESRPLGQAVRYIRQIATPADGSGPDADLLGRFVPPGDEAAFASLVERYGPLVLGVCRRALQNHDDSGDAFQATFRVAVGRRGGVHPARAGGRAGRVRGVGRQRQGEVPRGGHGSRRDRPGDRFTARMA